MNLNHMLKTIKEDWFVLLLGLGILYFLDIKFFLFYLLVVIIFFHKEFWEHSENNYLEVKNDRILKIIFRHLKISEEEKEKILEEAKADMSKEYYKWLEEDLEKYK